MKRLLYLERLSPRPPLATQLTDRDVARSRVPSPQQFAKGKAEGRCKVDFEEGQTYEGEMLHGLRSGLGKLVDGNGFQYEGNWIDGVPAEPAAEIVLRADEATKAEPYDAAADAAWEEARQNSEPMDARFSTTEDGNVFLMCVGSEAQDLPTLSFDVISGYREVEPEEKTAEQMEAEAAAAAAAEAEAAKAKKGKKGKGGKKGKAEEDDDGAEEEKEPERVAVLCTAEQGRPFELVAQRVVDDAAQEGDEGKETEDEAKGGEEGEEKKEEVGVVLHQTCQRFSFSLDSSLTTNMICTKTGGTPPRSHPRSRGIVSRGNGGLSTSPSSHGNGGRIVHACGEGYLALLGVWLWRGRYPAVEGGDGGQELNCGREW